MKCPICKEEKTMWAGSPCRACGEYLKEQIDVLIDRIRDRGEPRLTIWDAILEIADDITENYEREAEHEDKGAKSTKGDGLIQLYERKGETR